MPKRGIRSRMTVHGAMPGTGSDIRSPILFTESNYTALFQNAFNITLCYGEKHLPIGTGKSLLQKK